MKYILPYDDKINERLGIPEGNTEAAMDVFDIIVDNLSKIRDKSVMDKTEPGPEGKPIGTYSLFINKSYLIKEKKIEGVKINFKFLPDEDKVDLAGMSVSNVRSSAMGYTAPPVGKYPKSIDIEIRFLVPQKGSQTFGEILNHIQNDGDEFFSSLAHELKHTYDSSKRRESFASVVKYKIPELVRFGIPAVDEFLFFFYLIHKTESLVRPSEMGSVIQKRGIKKQDFLNFFKENKIIQRIKNIRDWSYDKMKKDLLDQVGIIKKRLDQNSIPYPEEDEKVVDLILELLHQNILKSGVEELDKMYMDKDPSSFLRRMFSGSTTDPWDPSIEKFLRKMRSKDYNGFFTETEKYFKEESDQVIRKLAKLYDLAESEDVELEEAKSSILNMEAHWKIKGTSPRIVNTKKYRKK